MSGSYIIPRREDFLPLSGGTVTGNTWFDGNLSANTYYSGATSLSIILDNIVTKASTAHTRVQGGVNIYTGGTDQYPTVNLEDNIILTSVTAATFVVRDKIEPDTDDNGDVGTQFKRFRSLNTVNGVAVNFTASTKIQLGSRTMTEYNIILTGDCVDGGRWL